MPKTFSNKPFPEATRGAGRFCLAIYLVNFVDWITGKSSKVVAWCKLCHGVLDGQTAVFAHYNRKHSFSKEHCLFCDLCKKPIPNVAQASCGSTDPHVQQHLQGRSHMLNKMRASKPAEFAIYQETLKVCDRCYHSDDCSCGPDSRRIPLSKVVYTDIRKNLSVGPFQELRDTMPLDRKTCFAVNEQFAYVNGPCDVCLGGMFKLSVALNSNPNGVLIADAFCAGQSSKCTGCSTWCRDNGKPPRVGSDLVVFTGTPFTKALCVTTTTEKAPAPEPTHMLPALAQRPQTLTKKEWAMLPDDEQDLYTLSRGVATLTI